MPVEGWTPAAGLLVPGTRKPLPPEPLVLSPELRSPSPEPSTPPRPNSKPTSPRWDFGSPDRSPTPECVPSPILELNVVQLPEPSAPFSESSVQASPKHSKSPVKETPVPPLSSFLEHPFDTGLTIQNGADKIRSKGCTSYSGKGLRTERREGRTRNGK